MTTEVYLLNKEQLVHYQKDIDDCFDANPVLWSRRFGSKDDIWQRVFEDYIQIWAVCDSDSIHGVFMTEVIDGPVRILRVFWGFGHSILEPRTRAGINFVWKAFAEKMKCTEIEITGRRGWEKILRADGYEFVCVTLRLPISKEMKGH